MIKEEKVVVTSDINIGATIAYQDKKEKRPLVLLIAGPGSLDRDGNSFAFKSNLYKDLSDMFVKMGCVCIRYDKRGTHESKGSDLNFGLSDLVNDAATIVRSAKNLDYVDSERVVICGHSEGAMIATLLIKKEELRGIILLGGAGMSLKDAMLYQNYLVLEHVKDMKGILGWFLRKTLKPDKIEEQVSGLFNKAEQTKKDTICPIAVAHAAPSIPHFRTKIKIGSKTILITAPRIVVIMPNFGKPWALINPFIPVTSIENAVPNREIFKYSSAYT